MPVIRDMSSSWNPSGTPEAMKKLNRRFVEAVIHRDKRLVLNDEDRASGQDSIHDKSSVHETIAILRTADVWGGVLRHRAPLRGEQWERPILGRRPCPWVGEQTQRSGQGSAGENRMKTRQDRRV
jgi:hypothetical protein